MDTRVTILSGTSWTVPRDWTAAYVPPHKAGGVMDDVRLKLERAEQHIEEIKKAESDYGASHVLIPLPDQNDLAM